MYKYIRRGVWTRTELLSRGAWNDTHSECRRKSICFSPIHTWRTQNLIAQLFTRTLLRRNPHTSKCFISSHVRSRQLPNSFPVLDGAIQPIHRHVYEANFRNSTSCHARYSECMEKVRKGGGDNAVLRHTQRNKKLLVWDRLRQLLDGEDFLELSPFAGLGMPYGDVPSAGCVTGVGKISGLWCVFIANDATVKGGTAYPITVKKQLRAQDVAIQNHLPCVYLVDSGGGFLPLQCYLLPPAEYGIGYWSIKAELFPDKNHGGRTFYNEAIMSAMKIPQVAVVCGSCTAGGAYIPTMAEETVMVERIGTIFLGGPPLVKAATGEEVTSEELGGARLHAEVSGCVDHFSAKEQEAYECARNIITTLNFELPLEDLSEEQDPLYSSSELHGLAPRDYTHTLDIKLIVSRLTDGSRFQEFKALYGTTLVTGFARIEGHLVGVVANNGELTYEAALKGSHFVQLCDQRGIPLIFLQNTPPYSAVTGTLSQAEINSNRLKAQASMMSAVACASTPKITVVIGGCYGGESYAMCGRSFDPNFLFLWPNARVAAVGPEHSEELSQWAEPEVTLKEKNQMKKRLEEESSAFYSSGRVWDDGVILPKDTRKVLDKCLRIIKQQDYQLTKGIQSNPVLRM